jgi:uncharacterized membrane protein required for colicin V production
MKLGNIGVYWVDFVVVGLLAVGIFRGQRRGMSDELLDIVKWFLILIVGALTYDCAGRWLAQQLSFSLLYSYLMAYIFVGGLIYALFLVLRQHVNDKLLKSDLFGQGEYYLGMMAGGFRYACVILICMACIHARQYTLKEIAEQEIYIQKTYEGLDPSLVSLIKLQRAVFASSITGNFVKKYLHVVLIRGTTEDERSARGELAKPGGQSVRAQAREQKINEILVTPKK